MKLIGDPKIRNLDNIVPTDSKYVGVVRQQFNVIQTILPKYEYVDLTKWIKQHIDVKL